MQAVVNQPGPSAGSLESGCPGRIGRDTRHLIPGQQRVDGSGQPAGMPRLADHRSVVARAQQVEESAGHARIEDVRRRQLHEQRPALLREPRAFHEKLVERDAGTPQRELVRDVARHLHRELEVGRRARRPLRVGGGDMRAIERGVDFSAAEPSRVALEMGPGPTALRGKGARNRPTRGADEQPSGHSRTRAAQAIRSSASGSASARPTAASWPRRSRRAATNRGVSSADAPLARSARAR